MNLFRLAPAALLLAACAPLGSPALAPVPNGALHADLLRLADRREWNEAALRAAAASPDPAVQRRAIATMANLRRREAVPLLQPLLASADTSVAAEAAFALGQIGDTAAVAGLVPYAAAARIPAAPSVVGEAAYALGKLRDPRAKEAIRALLADAPLTGAGVAEAVGPALLAIWRQPRPLPVAAVERWLESADSELRWRAAYALARRAEPAASAALFRRAWDADGRVRSMVARGLSAAMADSAGIGAAAAEELLIRLANDDTVGIVRINALRTLGGYRTERARAQLERIASIGIPYETVTAMESLQRMGAFARPSVPVLEQEASDVDMPAFVRQTALAALGDIDRAAALRVAARVADEGRWRMRAAAARIVAADTAAREAALAYVRDADGRVASAALEAAIAADTSGRAIRPLLLAGLESADPVARTNALGGLAALRDPSTLPAVLDAYARAQRDTLNDAALAAVAAVAAIAERDSTAARQFVARFPRSADYLVRDRAKTALGAAAAPWGEPLPIDTDVSAAEYERIVRRAAANPRPRAVIETDRGQIEVELFADAAPLTARSFLSLAARGFFDGQEWPRVVPNFVIQGGDPRGDTSGGPGYSIRDEINRHLYDRGALGMALSGPDTGGSQWFVTHSAQPHLDGTYTVFGRVVRGMDVADVILPGDRIIRIREVR